MTARPAVSPAPAKARSRPAAAARAALVAAARQTRKNAYAPYSNYLVGAAVVTADGTVFTGVNVENASYGLSMCAERVAIFQAAAAGHRRLDAVAVVTQGPRPGAPCGACRQVMAEFGVDRVYLAAPRGSVRTSRLRDLLPEAFSPADLKP